MISSISGRTGFPGLGNYCASKFALEAWTETLRMEVRSLGIQVVLIEPGAFETEIWGRNAIVTEQTQSPHSPNAERIARWRKKFESSKQRPDAQEIADAIARILDDPRPKLRYVFGPDAKMGLTMRRLLPWALFERMLIKGSGIDG